MIWLSALLVFGTLALIGAGVSAETSELPFGARQIIHGRVPWLIFGLLWGGVALGVASLFRGRHWPKLGVLVLEIVPVSLFTWYVVALSALPANTLSVAVGDPFPSYALQDQDGTLREVAALEPRPPALYIFYRGDW